jgi:hypothetical protein
VLSFSLSFVSLIERDWGLQILAVIILRSLSLSLRLSRDALRVASD